MNYRQANSNDIKQLRKLAVKSWGQFEKELTIENWQKLFKNLNSLDTYIELVNTTYSLVCENSKREIIGMAFLVAKGNPTEIFDAEWSYLRYVTVDTEYGGQGIGKVLTEKCIEYAKKTNEQIIALHTSEMMNNARRLYEGLGFTVLRELDIRLGKRYWLYTLDIS